MLDEMLNFSDLLCAPGITVPLRHELIGYERTSWQGGMDRAKEGGTPPPWVTASTGSCLLGGIPTFFSTYSSSFSSFLPITLGPNSRPHCRSTSEFSRTRSTSSASCLLLTR